MRSVYIMHVSHMPIFVTQRKMCAFAMVTLIPAFPSMSPTLVRFQVSPTVRGIIAQPALVRLVSVSVVCTNMSP